MKKKFSEEIAEEHGAIFTTVNKYYNDQQFVSAAFDAAFSTVHLYFDQVKMAADTAVFQLDAVFSTVIFYVPETWTVRTELDVLAGQVKNQKEGSAEKTLLLTGDVVFGTVSIRYIPEVTDAEEI